MVDNKVPLRNIAAVTGHRLGRVNRIIERYAIDTDGFADEAMKIVNRGAGGEDSDFDATDFGTDRDWEGGSKATYKRPRISEDRPGRYLGALLGQHRLKHVAPTNWPADCQDEESGTRAA